MDPKQNDLARFVVEGNPGQSKGQIIGPGLTADVTLGRAGIIGADNKREGDGATPSGCWRMLAGFYRPDREKRPISALPLTPLTPDLGWCDEPDHPSYNSLIYLPFSPSHEVLWRDDSRYDLIVVLDHNTNPVEPHKGSAIFLHIMADDGGPTVGCVGFHREDLLSLLRLVNAGEPLLIG